MAGLMKRKLEARVEIKESANDVFHDIYQNRPHDCSKVNPDFVQGVDVHEGAHGTPGSTFIWRYTLGGKSKTLKEMREVVDEKNKIIKFKIIEGDIMELYKSLDCTLQVFPGKTNESSIVSWTFEYEKKQLDVPESEAELLLDSVIKLAKQIEEHHQTHNK